MDDIATFFHGPGRETGSTLQLVRRLHIIHVDHSQEPTYLNLIKRNRWDCLDGAIDIDPMQILVENGTYIAIAQDLMELCPKRSIMPRLERIVMGGIRDSLWTSYPYGWELRAYDRQLAHILIDLPSVKHYCQSVQVGPLSLPSGLLELDHRLETFTHHAVPGHGPSPHAGGMPPVIIGAINRYYFSCNHTLVSMDGKRPMISPKELGCILILILQMYHQTVTLNARSSESRDIDYDITDAAAHDTTIEIYDFIRHVRIHPPEIAPPWPYYDGKGYGLADRPAESLEVVQNELDLLVFEKWQGRVIFKNREDAPPCAACDLDPKEKWKVERLPQVENPSSVCLSRARIDDRLQYV